MAWIPMAVFIPTLIPNTEYDSRIRLLHALLATSLLRCWDLGFKEGYRVEIGFRSAYRIWDFRKPSPENRVMLAPAAEIYV